VAQRKAIEAQQPWQCCSVQGCGKILQKEEGFKP